jgi:hypothetical protein
VPTAQISAYVSDETKEEMERFTSAHGLKKGALVEQALLHHLQALREIPADLIIPPRLELTEASFVQVVDLLASPRPPTKAMRTLMGKSKG